MIPRASKFGLGLRNAGRSKERTSPLVEISQTAEKRELRDEGKEETRFSKKSFKRAQRGINASYRRNKGKN